MCIDIVKKMKNSRLVLLLLFCTIVLSGCGFISGMMSKQSGNKDAASGNLKKPEKPKFKIPVTAETLKRGRMYSYLQAVGTVVPSKEIDIKPEMSGRIFFTKRWMEGDEVQKETLYATLDERELRLNVNDAQLNLEISKARVEPASAQLMQAYKEEEFKTVMFERGAISKADLDLAVLQRIQRKNSYEEALKNIESREMALTRMKQELEKIQITLPFSGVLLPPGQSSVNTGKGGETDLTLMNGQMVGASTVLCRLANIDQVFLALDVPSKDLMEIQIGQEVEIDIYTKTGKEYRGTVAEISTSLNSSTRTYTVNVLVDNPEHELRPGMFAKARIITKEKLDAISIPRDLVLLRNNKSVVFVVEEKPFDEIEDTAGETDYQNTEENKNNPADESKTISGGNVAVADEWIDDATDTDEFLDDELLEADEPETIPLIAKEREIVLGIDNRERVEVIDGLKEGELLVVLGYETLTDNVDVNITMREKSSPGIHLPTE